jgi:acetoacetyl-CoA reductase
MTSRVALVTGGTGGIGTAICQRLADQGHRVATNYRDEAKARAWQQAMTERGYSVSIFPGDVSDPGSAAALVRAVEAALGPVEILVNNAGITRDTTFHRMRVDQWHDVINTNLSIRCSTSPARSSRACADAAGAGSSRSDRSTD